jgi:hypothetical protein
MFIGHFAVALAAKKAAPRVSLGTLFISVQLLDLIWPVLVLAGIEHVRIDVNATLVTPLDFYDYPISHSLLGTLVWAALLAILYFGIRKNRLGAGVLAIGVASHWFLDLIMHRPDLPVLPNGPYLGLGLWNSLAGTMAVEGAIFAAAAFAYVQAPESSDRIGTSGCGGLLAFLGLIWIGNIFGEPPPSDTVVAVAANALWLVVAWGYWVDRHRTQVPAQVGPGIRVGTPGGQ